MTTSVWGPFRRYLTCGTLTVPGQQTASMLTGCWPRDSKGPVLLRRQQHTTRETMLEESAANPNLAARSSIALLGCFICPHVLMAVLYVRRSAPVLLVHLSEELHRPVRLLVLRQALMAHCMRWSLPPGLSAASQPGAPAPCEAAWPFHLHDCLRACDGVWRQGFLLQISPGAPLSSVAARSAYMH